MGQSSKQARAARHNYQDLRREETKAITKISSKELVMNLDTKEVIGAIQMANGQVTVFFAGQDVIEMLETLRG